MATPFKDVYSAFLSKIEEDEWMLNEDQEIVEEDWFMLLSSAISQFRYPHISLDYDKDAATFNEDLSNDEIQILANLMKLEWVRRCIATWDNLRQLYSNKSQANFLSKMNETEERINVMCKYLLDRYDRSYHFKPNKIFSKLAGK